MTNQSKNPVAHHSGCACCADLLTRHFSRRRLLYLAAGSLTAAALTPWQAFADGSEYEAMVLSCIDPRFQEPVRNYTAKRELTNKYSQFTIAGAAVGVVAHEFRHWHETFWDNLGASIQLHRIPKVIVINHRDCGAARIAYGDEAVADRASETKTHRKALAKFRKQLHRRHPHMGVETGLMDLDGKLEMTAWIRPAFVPMS